MSARYNADEYTSAIQSLLPVGRVWPKMSDSVISAVIRSLAEAYQHSDADATQLLMDSFPGSSSALLPEWEATLGLPDDCACNVSNDEITRRHAVISKLIGTGGQSATYFISLAKAMGYGISIKQYRQARAGLSVCGDAINGDRWPYVWEVNVTNASNDSTCSLKLLLCRLAEFSPAHTKFALTYDVISLYGLGVVLSYDSGVLTGVLKGESCIDVSDVDITLIYTLSDKTVIIGRTITDENGRFSVEPKITGGYTVVARAQILTPLCEWENVSSKSLTVGDVHIYYSGAIKYDGKYTHRG